jgi:heme exporter protein B
MKAAAHWVTTGLPLVIAAPVLGVLLHLEGGAVRWLILGLIIGTPALSMIGAFGAGLTVGLKRGGLLMSLLVLPLYVPTLIFGAEVVKRGALGMEVQGVILILSAITLAVWALLPFAAAAALRINLR